MKRRLEAGATERTVLGASSASQVWVRCLSFPFGFTSTSLLLLHLGGQAAPGELQGDLIANGHLFGGAHNIARSVVTDRVAALEHAQPAAPIELQHQPLQALALDRKSTRLNSSHGYISYAVFCLKKKKNNKEVITHDS